MVAGMVITIVGFLLLLDKMGIVSGAVWTFFWPILIIYIGLWMMYSKANRSHFLCDCLPHEKHGAPSAKRRSSK